LQLPAEEELSSERASSEVAFRVVAHDKVK
jgi:hypothetical protein